MYRKRKRKEKRGRESWMGGWTRGCMEKDTDKQIFILTDKQMDVWTD
jgi:hypothetical protein